MKIDMIASASHQKSKSNFNYLETIIIIDIETLINKSYK
jgi:hypothetical protein